MWTNTHTHIQWAHVHTHRNTQTVNPPSPTPNKGASVQFHTNKWCFLFFFIIHHPQQSRDGGWNDNKWAPLEELLAIKGNREPQYATPVSPAKLKQITPTSIAYYAANEDNLFIIIILIHLFDHHWAPISMTYITSFPVCKHGRRLVSRQGQLQIVATEAATSAHGKTALRGRNRASVVRELFIWGMWLLLVPSWLNDPLHLYSKTILIGQLHTELQGKHRETLSLTSLGKL